jgi:hypothetical protein
MDNVIPMIADKEYGVTLTGTEVVKIVNVLSKLPYEEVSGTIDKIKNQVANQVQEEIPESLDTKTD